MLSRVLLLVVVLPLLAACNAYHPLSNGVGFTEIPFGQDSFQVTYTAEGATPIAEARQYCLTRAAELALLNNQTAFEILDEHIYIGYGTSYSPATYYPTYAGRRGYGGRYYGGGGVYSPGYVDSFTLPEVTMQIRFVPPNQPSAIPAAYILREAQSRGTKLSEGIPERLATLPAVSAPPTIPPAPTPTTKPAPKPQ